ncbi:MAG: hypothetical protein RJA81_1192 [Planctomycetota bacterium]
MIEPSWAYESDPVGIIAGSQRIDAKGVSPSGGQFRDGPTG